MSSQVVNIKWKKVRILTIKRPKLEWAKSEQAKLEWAKSEQAKSGQAKSEQLKFPQITASFMELFFFPHLSPSWCFSLSTNFMLALYKNNNFLPSSCSLGTREKSPLMELAVIKTQATECIWAECTNNQFQQIFMLFFMICADRYRSSASTTGILFQKYVYSSFSMRMVLNCVHVCRFVLGQGSGTRKGSDQKCSALKLGNVPSVLVWTVDCKSCEAGRPIFVISNAPKNTQIIYNLKLVTQLQTKLTKSLPKFVLNIFPKS